jgi:O-antigen/teichoic acid export membrane protein
MDYLGMSAVDVEFVTSSITTWAPKINMIVSSISMGMTVSLIPTIVSAFTLKNWDEVNNKLNQALQMIIMISLPMTVGIALLSAPVWSVFYGLKSSFGPMILTITIFVTLVANIYMITSSTLQSLNKFKLVYKSAILGFVLNAILDVPIMLLFNKMGIPSFLGAGVASIIGYASASVYVLYVLRKEHNLRYGKTFRLVCNLIVPILMMAGVVLLTMYLIPVNFDSKLSCIIYITINAAVGALVYGLLIYKNGVLKDVLGDRFGIITRLDKIFKRKNK